MADIFISYANQDRDFAENLANRLGALGASVWWDRQIEHGRFFDREIERELNAALEVIVIWSPHSIESNWCRAAAASALEQHKLVPISIKNPKIPIQFRYVQTGDFSNWKGSETEDPFVALRRSLGRYVKSLAPPAEIAAVHTTGRTAANVTGYARQVL